MSTLIGRYHLQQAQALDSWGTVNQALKEKSHYYATGLQAIFENLPDALGYDVKVHQFTKDAPLHTEAQDYIICRDIALQLLSQLHASLEAQKFLNARALETVQTYLQHKIAQDPIKACNTLFKAAEGVLRTPLAKWRPQEMQHCVEKYAELKKFQTTLTQIHPLKTWQTLIKSSGNSPFRAASLGFIQTVLEEPVDAHTLNYFIEEMLKDKEEILIKLSNVRDQENFPTDLRFLFKQCGLLLTNLTDNYNLWVKHAFNKCHATDIAEINYWNPQNGERLPDTRHDLTPDLCDAFLAAGSHVTHTA